MTNFSKAKIIEMLNVYEKRFLQTGITLYQYAREPETDEEAQSFFRELMNHGTDDIPIYKQKKFLDRMEELKLLQELKNKYPN